MTGLPALVLISLVHKDELKWSAWSPILAVSLSMVAFISIKTARDTVFFNEGGLSQLPVAYIWIALASVPAGMLHLAAMKRWGVRRVRTGLLILTAGLFLLFAPFTAGENKLAMMAMFVLVPVVFAAVFAAAWLLAADIFDGAGSELTRWAYSRIGAGSMIGGILGGLLAGALSQSLSPEFLVAAGSLLLLLVAGVVWRAHRLHPIRTLSSMTSRHGVIRDRAPSAAGQAPAAGDPTRRTLQNPRLPAQLLKIPYVRGLIGMSALASLAALFIDFQFYSAVTFSGNTNPQFFAGFYTLLNSGALLIQLLVAPRLQSRFGSGFALMVLPSALFGWAGLSVFGSTIQSRFVMKLTESGLKSSLHRSVWEQVFLPVGRGSREIAKVLVDGVSARVAEGVGAGLLYFWLWTLQGERLGLASLTWLLLGVLLCWTILTFYMRNHGCSDMEEADYRLRLPDS